MAAPRISIVIPTLSEAGMIREILEGLAKALKDREWEALVVDDDSGDGTPEIVEKAAKDQPRVRLIRRSGRPDLAGAVRDGFAQARGAYLGSMNADGSHDPGYWPAMIDALDAGSEAVIGSRYVAGGRVGPWPWQRRALSHGATFMVRKILRLEVRDPLSGFYAMKREVYERCRGRLDAAGFKVLLELLIKGRPRGVAEVPISFENRRSGKSKLTSAVLWRAAAGVARLCVWAARERASSK